MTIGDRIPRHTPTRIETVFGRASCQPVAAQPPYRQTRHPQEPTSAPPTASGTSLQQHSTHPCAPR